MTGSRIRTNVLDKQAPIIDMSRTDLDRSGETSVGDLLQKLPVSGGALNTKFNDSGNNGFPPDGNGIGAGSTQADLRYLGSKRVLVLVDGVRWIQGASASGVPSATDLNTIPMGMIERIEVLQDGASPIYGSDAIAGVINIITRKNYSGAFATAYAGGYGDAIDGPAGRQLQLDGFTQQYNVGWGNVSDRMSLLFAASFADQRRVVTGNRDETRWPMPNMVECNSRCSSYTPQGRIVFTDPTALDPTTGRPVRHNIALRDGYDLPPGQSPNWMAHYDPFTSDRRFNWGPLNLVLTPSRRFGTSTQLGYHLSPQVQAHARIAYTRRRSVNQAAPEPLPIGPGGGGTGPLTALTIPSFDPNLAAALPSRYQNFSPFPFALTPETNFVIYRRPLEGGPRIFNQTVNTLVASGGLAGDFSLGSQDFHWDTTFVYGVNRADQIKNNAYDAERIRKALSYNECALDPKCVPLNIFGGRGSDGSGTITREMLDYIQFVQKDVSQQTLIDLTLNITGGIAELPGGTMGFATGVELRRHQGFFQPDGIVARGDTAGIPAAPTRGSIDVAEGYAEVRLPLFDQAGPVDLWDVSGAARVSSYSTSGTQTTYRVGSRLRLVDDVLFRGSWGQGFRAPGIGELFGSPARFDQDLADRCSDFNKMHQDPVKQQEQAQIAARCQQVWNAGILPSDGSYTQANSQLPVTTGGNPELKAETSTSLTASLVYSPSFVSELPGVDRLSLEVTYYRYQINDPIQAINGQVTLDRCVLGNDQAACDRIARVPGGAIQRIDGQLTNFGSISTDGVDFTLSYWSPHTAFGQFRLTSLSSVLLSFSEILPAGSQSGVATIERAGTEVGSPLRAYPRLKSSLILDWLHSPNLRASWTLRYLGSVTESCGRLPDTDLVPGETITYHEKYCTDPQSDERTMPMTFYNNVQVTWSPERLDRRLDFTVGVNNILNQAPPACYSCGRGFDATTYEIPGVFGYVRAGYRL